MLLRFQNNSEYGSANAYYFHRGESFAAYEFLSAHRVREKDGIIAYSFVTYEKSASSVELIGDFNDGSPVLMQRLGDHGLYGVICESPIALEGCAYRFRIKLENGDTFTRHDPYARLSFVNGTPFSEISGEASFDWQDKKYLTLRKKRFSEGEKAMKVHDFIFSEYEAENYREIAERISEHAVREAFTYVRLHGAQKALSENAFDGCFAVDSRFGSPDDFRALVSSLHSVGVGVIVDAFPLDFSESLRIDGETASLMISSALFYLRELHVDGLCLSDFASTCEAEEHRELMRRFKGVIASEMPDALIFTCDERNE